MNRRFRVAITSGAAMVLLSLAAESVRAQEPRDQTREDTSVRDQQRAIDRLEETLNDYELALQNARTAEDCNRLRTDSLGIDDLLQNFRDRLGEPIQQGYRRRARELQNRACPAPAATAPSPPDADDIEAIIDDPDAGLRSQGLAPQERVPGSAAIDGTGFGTGERLLRNALMNNNCLGAETNFNGMKIRANEAEEAATTAEQRDLVEEWRRKIAYYQPLVEACGEPDFAVPWPVGEPTLTSPRVLPGNFYGIEGGDIDRVDRDLRWLSRMGLNHECAAFEALVARLRTLSLDYEQAYELDEIVRRGCQPRTELQLGLSVGQTETVPVGIGFTRDGPSGSAPETDAGVSPDSIDTRGLFAGYRFGDILARGGYVEGDASSAFDRQPGSGGANGSVFGGPAPSGSSGNASSSASTSGTSDIDYSRFGVGVDLAVLRPSPGTTLFLTFDYDHEERTYASSLAGTVGSGGSAFLFEQERDQRVVDDRLGLGARLEFGIPVSGVADGGLTFSGSFGLRGELLDSSLDATERNTANFGPGSDRDFTLQFGDSETKSGVAVTAAAEFGYALSPNLVLFAGGAVEYRSNVGGVFNPNSGDQVFYDDLTTALITDDSWSYHAMFGIRIRLGRWDGR